MVAPADPELLALQQAAAGRYLIERELGRGGMGIVMLARDVALERPVAIKLLPAALTNVETRARFVREARTSARLSHPNIVPIYSVEDHRKLVFFVMGYVEGETLTERVRRAGPMSATDGARVVQELAWALAYAHSAGVVHRDVKPDNVLLDRVSGRAMLSDFGIARVTDEPTLSGRGEVLGTAQFVSPEQAGGGEVDGRSDFYSLGVTAFFALSGRLPFEATSVLGLLGAHVTQAPPPLASVRRGLSPKLSAAIDRCLAKDPDDRFQTGEALAEAIAESIGSARDAPPAIRAFMRDRDRFSAEIVAYLGAGVIFAPGQAPAQIAGAVVLLLGISLMQLARSALVLRRAGFDFDDVRACLTTEARRRAEEAEAMDAAATVHLERATRLRRRLFAALAVLAGVLAIVRSKARFGPGYIAFDAQVGADPVEFMVGALVALAGMILFALTFSRGTRTRRPPDPGSVRGKLATVIPQFLLWLVGAVARIEARPAASVSFKPTEVVLADEAADMIDSLPAALRDRLGDASAVLDRLKRHISRLRERELELAATLAQAGGRRSTASQVGGGGTLAQRRAALSAEIAEAVSGIVSRRESAVAAMENIRIQLLRLRTGLASPADFTADLEAAIQLERELGDFVDARTAAT